MAYSGIQALIAVAQMKAWADNTTVDMRAVQELHMRLTMLQPTLSPGAVALLGSALGSTVKGIGQALQTVARP